MTPPALAPVGEGLDDGRVALRREHGLRRDQHAASRRSAPAHLSHARRRQDVDADHRRAFPDGGIVNAVREDPKRRGPAVRRHRAGGLRVVRRWRPLAVAAANMPATSIRDLVIKDDDLVVGTHGAIVLDPRRHHAAAADHGADRRGADRGLFAPQHAWRLRWNKNTDTPLPPDEPRGQNPPDGAILDYALKAEAKSVAIEILDAQGCSRAPLHGATIPCRRSKMSVTGQPTGSGPPSVAAHRRIASGDVGPPLSAAADGPLRVSHRRRSGRDHARAQGPWVLPGTYTVRLTVDGATMTQPLVVEMDPRVKTTTQGLQQQFTLSSAVV